MAAAAASLYAVDMVVGQTLPQNMTSSMLGLSQIQLSHEQASYSNQSSAMAWQTLTTAEVDAYLAELMQISEVIRDATPPTARAILEVPLASHHDGSHLDINHILAINSTAWTAAYERFESERVMRAKTGDTFVPEFFNERQFLGVVSVFGPVSSTYVVLIDS